VDEINEAALPRYGIDETAEKTGVSAATMRVWEQRYGWPKPERNESGYRLYSENQISDLARLKALLDNGFSLRDVIMDGAPRWPSERVDRPERPRFEVADLPEPRTPLAKKVRDRLIEALLTGDEGTVDWAVNQAPLIKPMERMDVYMRVLERAGRAVPEALVPFLAMVPPPTDPSAPVRRGRGRPRKLPASTLRSTVAGARVVSGAAAPDAAAAVPGATGEGEAVVGALPVRRGPGRPRKHPLPAPAGVVSEVPVVSDAEARPAPRRGSGRPPIAAEGGEQSDVAEHQARVATMRAHFAAARAALAVLEEFANDELVEDVHHAGEHERAAVAVALDLVRR
jgi:DNA-binding transcriptional MerR regulator